jgi:hypothetical protein
MWGLFTLNYRIKITQDCMVDQVVSELFSTAELGQKTKLGPNWPDLIAGMQAECVDERFGDLA